MNHYETNGHSSVQNGSDEDFELMGDFPREDPVVLERRRQRNNEITKKLGSYLLKGYCMLSDACTKCDCILLRTPERQLLCVGCAEVDVENAKDDEKKTTEKQNIDLIDEKESRLTSTQPSKKRKDRVKTSKKSNKHTSSTSETDSVAHSSGNYSAQLETKLKWAVDELAKSQNPNRVNAMCTVIIKLTETIKALKDYEFASV